MLHRLTATVEITFHLNDAGFEQDGGDRAAHQLAQQIRGTLALETKLVDIRNADVVV